MTVKPKGYCEVCKKPLNEYDTYYKKNICAKCFDEPCRPGCANFNSDPYHEEDIYFYPRNFYLKPEKELDFSRHDKD